MNSTSSSRNITVLVLSLIAAFLIFIVLPPSRDAMNGIVTVYRRSTKQGSLPPIEYKAVVEAQAVIELRLDPNSLTKTYLTFGFDKCSVFDRSNWRCERDGNKYLMQEGTLTINRPNGELLSSEITQVSRLAWLFN